MSDHSYKPQPKKYQHEYDENSPRDYIAMELEKKLAETLFQRSTLDLRMIEDLRQYNGAYDPDVEQSLKQNKQRSKVFVNLTRPKADAAEAQMVDLLFPNDDKNWGIAPTPVPELERQMDDETPAVIGGTQYQDTEGNPITNSDLVRREMELAKEAADLMEDEIEDQLVEARYNSKARRAIHDGVVLGTGVIKGPVVTGKLDRVYREVSNPETGESEFQLLMQEQFVPGVETVRPWDFYPDMSAATIDECEFVFERRYMSRKQVRELVHRRGYPEEQVRKVLQMGPTETQHQSGSVDDIRRLAGLNDTLNDSRYEVWEYHGPISNELLADFGLIDEDEDVDPLDERNGVIVYCGGVVLSVKPHVIDYDAVFPYYVWNWSQDESCIFGKGVPRLMRNEQKIMNTAWRAMLDNAAITAGPQIGLRRKHVTPLDGDWNLSPFKMWEVREGGSMKEAMQSLEFNSHQGELANIYSMSRQMVDEVTGIPMLQQGEQGEATQVLGGMSMLMNAANTVRRNQVKMWDDNVTAPFITSFYHFNMEFNDRNDIKGDYQVDARGTSALLVRETLANGIMNLINLAGANPMFQHVIAPKARDLIAQWAKTQQLPKTLIPTEEEVQAYEQRLQEQSQGEGEQQSPAEISAQAQIQVEQMRSELQQQKMQMDAQFRQQELQQKAQLKQMDAEARMQQGQIDLQVQAMRQETELYRLAEQGKIKGRELATRLEEVRTKVEADMAKFRAQAELGAQGISMRRN